MRQPDPDQTGARQGLAGFSNLMLVAGLNDSDEALLDMAGQLAERWSAQIHVLGVCDLPKDLSRVAKAAGRSEAEVRQALADERGRRVRERLQQAGLADRVVLHVALGKPFLEIIRAADRLDIDLVLKAAEPLEGLHRYLFASTDQHLLRKCPCPVWLRLPGPVRPARTVVAAVDVDDAGAGEPDTLSGLNHRIVEAAARVAAGTGAALHLLHVWDAPGESLLRLWTTGQNPQTAVDRYVTGLQTSLIEEMDRLAAHARQVLGPTQAKSLGPATHLLRGAARTVIPQQTAALGADLLVMGTIARTGVPGFIIGNTAEDILNSVECSVMTVKPPHYVSPVLRG